MKDRLPSEIIFFLFTYLDQNTIIECILCCKHWFSQWKRHFLRKRILMGFLLMNIDELQITIEKFVESNYDQLNISLHFCDIDLAIQFLSLNTELNMLSCPLEKLWRVVQAVESLRIKELQVCWDPGEFPEMGACFSKIVDCEVLSLTFGKEREMTTPPIPYWQHLKRLSLQDSPINSGIRTMLTTYSRTLYDLCLCNCDITDVSMLGRIPQLTLKECHHLVDISSLTHNTQIIIEECNAIIDFSQSFEYSRYIKLVIRETGNYCFDLSNWKNVETLILEDVANNVHSQIHYRSDYNQLPISVKRCELSGIFVISIDFTITAKHNQIYELRLSNNKTIEALQGYGLERLARIECSFLDSLQSLVGLGQGKNRKIVISYCDQIVDFSPLNEIPIVEITYCSGFRDPLQLRLVPDLTIALTVDISFHTSSLISPHPFQAIHSLSLSNTITLRTFDGLEIIPNLYIDIEGLIILKRFLRQKKQLKNQRIEIWELMIDDLQAGDIQDLHYRFLAVDYDYVNRLPTRWIWNKKYVSLNK